MKRFLKLDFNYLIFLNRFFNAKTYLLLFAIGVAHCLEGSENQVHFAVFELMLKVLCVFEI